MKTLRTLIRLKKEDVDKLQKEMAQIQARQLLLQEEHKFLSAELESEAEVAANFPETTAGFALFAKKTIERQRVLLKNIEMLQTAIDKKRDELLVEFSEQKKFEIALERQQLAEFNEGKRRETIAMDEVATRSFVRKDN